MGFGIIYDIQLYLKNKFTGRKFRFSLLTKVSVISYVAVAAIGLSFAFLGEGLSYMNNGTDSFYGMEAGFYKMGSNANYSDLHTGLEYVNYGSTSDKTMAIFFTTMSTRNAGFSTIDITFLSSGTLATYDAMMFIGSGPGSTAGGIRTTTFLVAAAAI
jgi:Trk-type K+ transport system membrane component